jgi:hypothetical protein
MKEQWVEETGGVGGGEREGQSGRRREIGSGAYIFESWSHPARERERLNPVEEERKLEVSKS